MTVTTKRPAVCEACRQMKPIGTMQPDHFTPTSVKTSLNPKEDGWAIVRNKKLHVLAHPVWVCEECKEVYKDD